MKLDNLPKEFVEKLEEDLAFLEKSASGNFGSQLKGMLPYLGLALGGAAVSGTYGYLAAKKHFEKHQESLTKSFDTLLSTHKEFGEEPDKFRQRFTELSLISPVVASNPSIAQKILKPRLDSGFDLEDVHRLASIQHNISHTPGIPAPSSKGIAAATSTFQNWSKFLLPFAFSQQEATQLQSGQSALQTGQKDVSDELSKIRESLAKKDDLATQTMRAKAPNATVAAASATQVDALKYLAGKLSAQGKTPEEINKAIIDFLKSRKGGGMGKQGSEDMGLIVSEECLGRMLADRYTMMKTAGILPNWGAIGAGAKEILTSSRNHMHDYIKMMAIPLAIGGGIKIIGDLMKQKANAQVNAQADQIFNAMRRSNSAIRENPELALQAFDTLKSFAPALAAKPLIAKTFIEHVISSDGRIPPDTAKMLADTQTLISKLDDTTDGGFIKGLQNPMGLFKHTIGGGKGKKAING